MPMMMDNLYTALREGGTSDDAARKAAVEVVDYTKQLSGIRTDPALVNGLLGVVVAGVMALLIKTFVG